MAIAINAAPTDGKTTCEHGAGDAIGRRVLNLIERQDSRVREIGADIQTDHDEDAQRQR